MLSHKAYGHGLHKRTFDLNQEAKMNGKNGKVSYEEIKGAKKRKARLRSRRIKAELELSRESRYDKRHPHQAVAVDADHKPLPGPFRFFDPLPKYVPVSVDDIFATNGDLSEGEGLEELAGMTGLVELSPRLGFRATIRVGQ